MDFTRELNLDLGEREEKSEYLRMALRNFHFKKARHLNRKNTLDWEPLISPVTEAREINKAQTAYVKYDQKSLCQTWSAMRI